MSCERLRPSFGSRRGWSGWQPRWLVSARSGLELRQNITATQQAERNSALLLLAVAGFSSLVTSTLLQPVLRAGLMEPLEVLNRGLANAEPDAAQPESIAVAEQPDELRPIAGAFNALQPRLEDTWEQQRPFVDGVAHELRTPSP